MSFALRLTMLGLLLLVSCSTPPRGRGPSDDPAPSRTPSAESDDDVRYDFEEEEPAPEAPGDVAFEEDRLPPRPEDVNSEALSSDPVTTEELDDPMDLPDPDGGERRDPEVVTPVQPSVTTPVPQGSAVQVVRGFRVQLFAVAELARANTMAREAQQRLGVEVHVLSEPPHYKVRAGDFTDRADAVFLKERAASLGYDGAWVVTDEVEIRK